MEQNKKILILAIGKRNFDKAQKLKKRLFKDNKKILIVTDCYLENHDISETKTIKYYQDFFRHIKYQEDLNNCHNFINSIEKIRLNKDLTFKDLVTYQGVSLWRMSTSYLVPELWPFFKDLCLSSEIINFELPQEIILIDGETKLENIFRTLAINKGIVVRPDKTKIFIKAIKRRISSLEYFLKKIRRFLKSLYCKWLNFINYRNNKHKQNSVVIFFIYLERYFDSFLPLIKKYRPDERLIINMPFASCQVKLKKENIEYQEFYGYLLYRVFDKKMNRFLNDIWKTISISSSFQSEFNYMGVNIWYLLKDMFWHLIFREFPEQIRNIEIVRKIILSHKPKCAVVADYSCEVVLPAKSFSVPTLSIPTNIHELYYFGGPISDYIAAPGNYWRESLLESGVKTEQIFTVGPLKSDLLFNIRFQRNKILQGLGLDEKLKTVVYIGSYLGQWFYHEDYLYQIHMVYRGLKDIKNVNLVTKMHPYASDFALYKKIAKQENCKNMLIIRDYDIWKLLYCCDLVISDFSTASYEAVLMDKMVVLFCNTYKYLNKDLWHFGKAEAALFINNFSELETSVKGILMNQEVQSALRENRKKYIKEHAWPFDGKAADRLKGSIEQISINNHVKENIYSRNGYGHLQEKEKTYA